MLQSSVVFIGTDEWPRFSEDHSLYVNSCQVKGEENGLNSNGGLGPLQQQPLSNSSSQQIENNLMASSSTASTASSSLEKGQWGCELTAKTENDNLKKSTSKKQRPPRPPPSVPVRNSYHQRKPLQPQPLKQQSLAGNGNGGHANDITQEDYSDSDLEEPLLIYGNGRSNLTQLQNLK